MTYENIEVPDAIQIPVSILASFRKIPGIKDTNHVIFSAIALAESNRINDACHQVWTVIKNLSPTVSQTLGNHARSLLKETPLLSLVELEQVDFLMHSAEQAESDCKYRESISQYRHAIKIIMQYRDTISDICAREAEEKRLAKIAKSRRNLANRQVRAAQSLHKGGK